MGEGEENRKEAAKKEHEKQKAIAKGLKREAGQPDKMRKSLIAWRKFSKLYNGYQPFRNRWMF
jgi:hypothetical protein